MIRSHGRYPYRSINDRPDYSWPDGRRLAVYVAMNIEQFSFGEGKGAGLAPPEQAQSPSVYSWRDYGNRVGLWRLLELFDGLDIPLEAQLNTAIYEHCPDIPGALRAEPREQPFQVAQDLLVAPRTVQVPGGAHPHQGRPGHEVFDHIAGTRYPTHAHDRQVHALSDFQDHTQGDRHDRRAG